MQTDKMESAIEFRPGMTEMKVGDRLEYPVRFLDGIRVLASNLGIKLGRKYKTRVDRETGTITVTRVE